TNTDLDTRELVRGQLIDDVLDAVLATSRALCAYAQTADIQRNIVKQNDNALGRDLVEICGIAYSFTGQIHKGLRLHEQDTLSAECTLADQRLELHAV